MQEKLDFIQGRLDLTLGALLAVVLLAGCSESPTRPADPSEDPLASTGSQPMKGGKGGKGGGQDNLAYDLSGGFSGSYSGAPDKDNSKELSFTTIGTVTIDFPNVSEADCTFSPSANTQQIKDNLLALAQQTAVEREVSFVIRKREGVGAVRTRDESGSPHAHMCWSTGHGLCDYAFVGTDVNDPTTRREFQFPAGVSRALRLLYSEGSGNSFITYQAICWSDDPVTVVVEPAS